MKTFKRFIFLLLSICFCLGLTLITAAAQDDIRSDAVTMTENEWQVLRFTNKERLAEGLEPLTAYAKLQNAGHIRANECDKYFSHTRPDGTNCFTVLDDLDIFYWSAGENIAWGYTTPASVVDGWMHSEGHRANILNDSFGHIAVGNTDVNWVQMFTSGSTYTYIDVCSDDELIADVGTSIEDMNLAVLAMTDNGTACYLPLDEAYCTGYDPYTKGEQTVTVSVFNLTCTFKVRVMRILNILSNPKRQDVKVNTVARFTVKATGEDVNYQWQYKNPDGKWVDFTTDSAGSPALELTAKTSDSTLRCRCKVTDSYGNTKYSSTAVLYVLGVTSNPSGQKVKADTTAKFTVSATGAGKTYQWQYKNSKGKWVNSTASSANKAVLKVVAKTNLSTRQYRCKITDGAGNVVYSKAATLYVLGITSQPVSTLVKAGSTAKFTVKATGAGKAYQWQYKNSKGKWVNCTVSTATTASLKLTAKASINGRYYRCKISDNAGNVVYSNSVRLNVK